MDLAGWFDPREEPHVDPAGAGQAQMGEGMGNLPADLRRLAQMGEGFEPQMNTDEHE